jgi:hypothetical protein
VPTQFGSFSFDDPFGASDFTFTLPAVTIFDGLGTDDLPWLERDADVDLDFNGPVPAGYPGGKFVWEGTITSFDWSKDGLAVTCIGALHQIDLYLAKPEYPPRPLPYEFAIARQFTGSDRIDLRTRALRMEWPSWWKTKYRDPAKGTASYLIPIGVKSGDNWTAMLTRSTGAWDQALTGYVQSLLSAMYTERGRFTIDLDPGRAPVLRHRTIVTQQDGTIPVIDPVWPSVDISLSEDWSQSVNTVYGSGTSLSGVVYTGQNVTPDGASTFYTPLAAARQVYPVGDKNGWFQRSRMRREITLQLQQGLDEIDAQKVATAHLARFGEPGVTGTITLGVDPTVNGVVMSRFLLKAGMTVQVPKILGSIDGLMLHITKSTADFTAETVTLTVDSKYRDTLTVDEVRLRGRDAMSVTRMLVAGGYSPPVSDQLIPWNYAAGSGCIPSNKQQSSYRLFRDMPPSIKFPWTEWTTKRPPKAAAWKNCYVRIGPANVNADKNWSSQPGSVGGVPIFLGQAGQIRLIQVAAYDRDGNIMKVPFHFSLYGVNGVNVQSMPKLIAPYGNTVAYRAPNSNTYYQNGQHYPFHPNAWESYKSDGTRTAPETQTAQEGAQLIRAWGSNYEKAGHWPGSSAVGDPATGLLVDESVFAWDATRSDGNFHPYSTKQDSPFAGQVFAMIYCDAQAEKEVFFAGRMFRVEPGGS